MKLAEYSSTDVGDEYLGLSLYIFVHSPIFKSFQNYQLKIHTEKHRL